MVNVYNVGDRVCVGSSCGEVIARRGLSCQVRYTNPSGDTIVRWFHYHLLTNA